jgi:hypothetical protein
MYPLVSRILLLPFKKQVKENQLFNIFFFCLYRLITYFIFLFLQLTCTVRPTSFVVPVKSYHTSGSLLLKSQPLYLKFRPNASSLVPPYYSRQLNLTSMTRKLSSNASIATGSISAKNAVTIFIILLPLKNII